MSNDNSSFNLLLSILTDIHNINEKFELIGENLKKQTSFHSLGLFLKIPNMELLQCRYALNLSEKFIQNTIFTIADPLIQDLLRLKTLDIKFPGQYVFEHEYEHLIITPVKFEKKLYGFIFMDKKEGYFDPEEITELEIAASLFGMLVKISYLEEILSQHNEMYVYYRVFNREAFLDKASMYFKMLKRYNRYLSLAIIQLGNYKNFLRFHSDDKAERMLKNLCTTFQADLRQSDLVGKISKDKIAILLPETSAENAFLTLNRLRKKTDDLENIHSFKLGWGIRAMDDSDMSMEDLLSQAEKAAMNSLRKNSAEILIS